MKKSGWVAMSASISAIALLLGSPAPALGDRLAQLWKETAKVLEDTKFTFSKAIEVAEKHSKGKAVSVHSVNIQQKFSIWVHCLVEDKCMIVRVDPKSGSATDMKPGVPADLSCSTAVEAVKLMETNKRNLLDGAPAAEAQGKGKAVAAKSEVKEGALTFSYVIVAGDKGSVVTVDGKTGQAATAEELKESPRRGG